MNIQNELSLLFNSLFSDKLLQTLLQIYQHTLLRQRRRAVNAGPGLGIKIKKNE